MLQVCTLNRETWKYIRAETDDDDEWLPNAKQKGVLGLPVRDEMIDGWLEAVAELEGMLKGKRLVPDIFANRYEGKGINLRTRAGRSPGALRLRGHPEAWRGSQVSAEGAAR